MEITDSEKELLEIVKSGEKEKLHRKLVEIICLLRDRGISRFGWEGRTDMQTAIVFEGHSEQELAEVIFKLLEY